MSLKEIDGKPIINSKKSIKITINKNDINKADLKEPADCAVARACRRELHAKEVRVHLGRVYLRTNEGNWTRYITTPSLRAEIIAFDRGGTFEPGTYHLKGLPPSHQNRTGEKHSPRRKKKGKSRSKPHIITNVRMGPA